MFTTVNYIFHTEWNWLVPLRVIKVVKITKADFYRGPRLGKLKKKYTIDQLRILNLMLFFRGRDHAIVTAEDSSSLDLEIRHKHNQLVIHHGEEQELKQETTAVPACYVPVCLKKKHNAGMAVWFTKATMHWSNFCIFVDKCA